MDDDDPPDLRIEEERRIVEYLKRERDHRRTMAITWCAMSIIIVILIAALIQIFLHGESQWATAAMSGTLTAAVAFLFSSRTS